MIGKFDKYVLQSQLTLFGFFALILALIFWINSAVKLLDFLLSDRQSALVFFELSALSLPSLLSRVIPIATFIAVVYNTNRLSADSELVIVQAAGYSPFRLARPYMIFSCIVALFLGLITNVLEPLSTYEFETRQKNLASNISAKFLNEGNFLHPAKNITFFVREISEAGELLDLYLESNDVNGVDRSFSATRAFIIENENEPTLLMFDGMAQEYLHATDTLSVTRFDSFAYSLKSFVPQNFAPQRNIQNLDSLTLIKSLSTKTAEGGAVIVEIAARINAALLSIAIALIGFSALLIGGYSRFGLWRQIGVAIILLIVVQLIDNTANEFVSDNHQFWPVQFAASIIGIFMAYLFLWKAGKPKIFRKNTRNLGELS